MSANLRKPPSCLLPFLVLLLAASAATATEGYVPGAVVEWKIGNSRVVDSGLTAMPAEGVLTTGYRIEAEATSGNAPITDGIFRVTVTAFSPAAPMPGQRPGRWYVTGRWEIVDRAALSSGSSARHDQGALRGRLSAELPFNPATEAGRIVAAADLPLRLIGGHWGSGRGVFMGNRAFEGRLELTLDRWQKVY